MMKWWWLEEVVGREGQALNVNLMLMIYRWSLVPPQQLSVVTVTLDCVFTINSILLFMCTYLVVLALLLSCGHVGHPTSFFSECVLCTLYVLPCINCIVADGLLFPTILSLVNDFFAWHGLPSTTLVSRVFVLNWLSVSVITNGALCVLSIKFFNDNACSSWPAMLCVAGQEAVLLLLQKCDFEFVTLHKMDDA